MSQLLQDLSIGERYSKAELRVLLDEPTLFSKTAGIFYCKNAAAILLFVTLEKGPDKPNYNDYFENSGKYFYWDSQKTQHINVPSIQNIVTGRTVPHLFVRLTEKSKSTVQPFTYLGSLAFESYDASTAKPVHIRFKVNNPIPIGQDEAIRTLYYWRPQAHGHAPTHQIPDVAPSENEQIVERHLNSLRGVAGHTQSKSNRQGYGLSIAERREVERHSMHLAQEELVKSGYSNVTDKSKTHSFDFECEREGVTFVVEVKGTTGTGEVILLTANEVRIHTEKHPDNILIVVSDIQLDRTLSKPRASGGNIRLLESWRIDSDRLNPLSFACELPPLVGEK